MPNNKVFRLSSLTRSTGQGGLHDFRVVRNRLQGYLRFNALSFKGMWANISSKARSGDIISGHMKYGTPLLPEWDLRYVTLLRDPIDRVVSEYHYNRTNFKEIPGIRKVYRVGVDQIAGTRSLSDYLKCLSENKSAYNPLTWFVTGRNDHDDAFTFLKSRYFHFGIIERLDLFSKQFEEKTGFPIKEKWENRTDSKKRYNLNEKDLEMIQMMYERDINLFEKAREYVQIVR
ncbi:hypothetical protein [Desulfosediminicola sp.]|uniref:hypothetical protein n=1 Tax=Desulfosediminicola sp. TaxID=2886825 RepID=UPI003AF221D0